MRGITRLGIGRGGLFAILCLAMLAAGCSKSDDKAEVTFDTSKLPRVTGAKQIFASPATTIFTSPDSVAQTADSVEKTLAAGGWQKYVAPNTAYTKDPTLRTLSLKKGLQALSVFITIAPAQNNATSVQYAALALKTDLPFAKDATDIEYSPDRPLLSLVTAEPADKTLDFYRKELGARGWSMWSEKTNGKQPADGPSGVVHERGAYAHYITDSDPSVAMVLTLQKADAGKFKVELKQWPVGILEPMHQAYLNRDNSAAMVEVSKLPRLDGATERADRSSSDKVAYSVPGTLPNTAAATKKLLAADGWKQYVGPLEEEHETLLFFKKGAQGLSVSFTISVGKTAQTTDQTTVSYSPARLTFALAAPDDATDLVFDEHRPYLNLSTAGTVEATRDFFTKQLLSAGWKPLSASEAAAKWPNAKLDGAVAYYDRGNKRPIMLSIARRDDKTNAEIRVAPFALPQTLEADKDIFGLPSPNPHKSAGGTGGSTRHEMHANVPAEVGTVLAFYRRELTARNWKEETDGAVLNPDQVTLNFTSSEGPAVLKLTHKYDLTTVSLVQQLAKPAAKPEPKDDTIDAMLKQAQQMVRDATADALAAPKSQRMAQANEPAETLRARPGNATPVPVPEGAEDVEFDGADGKLGFSSGATVKSLAAFYRSSLKQAGWKEEMSVINRPNMVVLDFNKGGKDLSFTIMQMGPKVNVSANGAGLVSATAKAAPDTKSAGAKPADTSPLASEDDLIAEESGGLPLPKRHTMSAGEKTPFRRNLDASVPLDVTTVLGFYRRELGKLNWKEESKGAVVAADNATIAFAAPEGPALLKLGRKDGETSVNLTVKNPDAAAKAGLVPKSGQAKVVIGNMMPAEATVTINKQTIKVAGGAGAKAPDGPTLDLAPGKYKFSVKLVGQPARNDELEVGADETWGLLIGPGGALPLRAY